MKNSSSEIGYYSYTNRWQQAEKMSTERDKMIKSLKEIVIPELRNSNFKGSFPHFRKSDRGKTNLLTFQFDRNGGGFIIELANWNESEFKTHWGKIIPLNKLTAHDLNERQRIYPNSLIEQRGTDSWFRYGKQKSDEIYGTLSKKVVDRIPIMEQYWTENKITEIEKEPVANNWYNSLLYSIKKNIKFR